MSSNFQIEEESANQSTMDPAAMVAHPMGFAGFMQMQPPAFLHMARPPVPNPLLPSSGMLGGIGNPASNIPPPLPPPPPLITTPSSVGNKNPSPQGRCRKNVDKACAILLT